MAGMFGTDGVRARINTGPMTAEAVVRLALAAGRWFSDNKPAGRTGAPTVVIGKDTRLSGYMLESALVAGFTSIGMNCRLLGPLPTPAVAHLTTSLRADLGVMISASHNPHHDNGIKLFGPDGLKLNDAIEEEISQFAAGSIALAEATDLGRARRMLDSVGRYVEFAKARFPAGLRLDGMKIVVDCANGAAYRTAPSTLFELGAEVIPIAVDPDGFNINEGCGAMHPEVMAAAVVTHGAHAGIALDGDADRLIMADENGRVINGDQVLGCLAGMMQAQGTLRGDAVVGTVMTNQGLERYLNSLDVTLHRAKVGDRYIMEQMRAHDLTLGGEPSGHVLLPSLSLSGDGLIAALQMLAALKRSDKPASEIFAPFEPVPQKLVNLRDMDRAVLDQEAVKAGLAAVTERLGDTGRILVRPSGTEPMVRVMVEADEEIALDTAMSEIILLLETESNKIK